MGLILKHFVFLQFALAFALLIITPFASISFGDFLTLEAMLFFACLVAPLLDYIYGKIMKL